MTDSLGKDVNRGLGPNNLSELELETLLLEHAYAVAQAVRELKARELEESAEGADVKGSVRPYQEPRYYRG